MTYQQQLQSEEWKAKRLEILERDNHTCQCCGSTRYLQVHHSKYDLRFKAWEYDNHWLTTLCKTCHEIEHKEIPSKYRIGTIEGTTFIEKTKAKRVRKPPKKYKTYEEVVEMVNAVDPDSTFELNVYNLSELGVYLPDVPKFIKRMVKENIVCKVKRKQLYKRVIKPVSQEIEQ